METSLSQSQLGAMLGSVLPLGGWCCCVECALLVQYLVVHSLATLFWLLLAIPFSCIRTCFYLQVTFNWVNRPLLFKEMPWFLSSSRIAFQSSSLFNSLLNTPIYGDLNVDIWLFVQKLKTFFDSISRSPISRRFFWDPICFLDKKLDIHI